MKINNPDFLTAKKDKDLRAFLVIRRNEQDNNNNAQLRTYMRLCLRHREKYTNQEHMIFIETDTEINIDNYSYYYTKLEKRTINEICFHMSVYESNNHIATFLNAIKKQSNVNFKVVAFNSCDVYRKKELIAHQLYGIVDNKYFLLDTYVGDDNLASPVK